MHTVNYLRVFGCEHDVAKRAERMERYRIDHRSQEKPSKIYLHNQF